jgi:PAS domain S-box-containing protein
MSELVSVIPHSVDRDPVRLALDSLREGFQIIGFNWNYVYVNPAAARHGRRDADDLVGQPMAEVYPGIDRTPLFAVLRKCMDERRSEVLENEFTFPDGTTRWFELRIQPVPAGICIYSSDIDDRKRRQQSRASADGAMRRSLGERVRHWFSRT